MMRIVEQDGQQSSMNRSSLVPSVLKRIVGLLLGLTLVFDVLPSTPSFAETCTKVNAVKVVSGVKYVCKKSGSTLQWVRQASNSVVNNQPNTTPSTTPTPTVKEWTKCPAAGRVSGSGAATLSCVKVNGKLQWVKITTLDTPSLRKPCRTEGAVGPWKEEFLICTSSAGGRVWDYPIEDDQAGTIPPVQNSTISYTLNSTTSWCFPGPNNFSAYLDVKLPSGEWLMLKQGTWVQRACGSSSPVGGFQVAVDLLPGTEVRMRVIYSSSLSYYYVSEPVTLGASRDFYLPNFITKLTPFTNWVSIQNVVGTSGAFGLEYVDYEKVNQDTILTYRLSANSEAFRWTSISGVTTDRGSATVVSQPVPGTVISPSGLIQLRLKVDTNYVWVNRISFDLTGLNGFSTFTKRVATDFTWR
jgi:hypothetical protein